MLLKTVSSFIKPFKSIKKITNPYSTNGFTRLFFGFSSWKNFNIEIKTNLENIVKSKGVQSQEFKQEIQKVNKLCYTTDLNKTIEVYQSICAALEDALGKSNKSYKNSLVQYSNLCLTARNREKFFFAQEKLYECIKPEDSDKQAIQVNQNLYKFYAQEKRFEDAFRLLEDLQKRAIQHYGKDTVEYLSVQIQKSRFKSRSGKIDETIDILKYIDEKGESVKDSEKAMKYAQLQLALIYSYKKDKEKVNYYLERALKNLGQSHKIWHEMAIKLIQIYTILGQHQKALDINDKALINLPEEMKKLRPLLQVKKLSLLAFLDKWDDLKSLTESMIQKKQGLDSHDLITVYQFHAHASEILGKNEEARQSLKTLSQTYDPNHSGHFHRVKLSPLFTRAALFYKDKQYVKACESFLECLSIFNQNRALAEKTDSFFESKIYTNLYFTNLQLRQWNKCREYGSQAFEKLHSKQIPTSEKPSLIDFHRTYVGFLRTQMRNTVSQEYEKVFQAYERLIKDSKVEKTLQYYGYLIEAALHDALVSKIEGCQNKLKQAETLLESQFRDDPNFSVYWEEIFKVRNIIQEVKRPKN